MKAGAAKKKTEKKTDSPRKILVTSALPYANGPIHLGHLVEYIQTDIWVRFLKLQGHEVYYFCADDTHGTAIMIAARKEGITPDELVDRVQKEHMRDFELFGIKFDNYYTTNSPENRELSEYIYNKSKEKNRIARKNVRQLYCETDGMFLPDRFVRGNCPVCNSPDQYGDSCEVCSSAYSPEDLKNPKCAVCGNPPEFAESEHLFFQLNKCRESLLKWITTPGRVEDGVRKKMDEWLKGELRDWDISRDGPYFGFEIPGEKNKFFYVWLDAPIGYMAASKNYFSDRMDVWDDFWKREAGTEVYHFIGKDIAYFHTLFWPALLESADFRTPTAVFVHGFLTLNGEKMSKSRGTLISAESYLRHLDPMALRYFYAARISGGLDDLDLASHEFIAKYNADVVGNLTNIFSRLCGSLAAKIDHTLSDGLSIDGELLEKTALDLSKQVMASFEARNFSRATREITSLGDEINRFINEREPWKSVKTDPESARATLTDALNAGRILAFLIKPILPVFAAAVEELLALSEELTGKNFEERFNAGHKIRAYRHISARIDPADFAAMLETEKKRIEAAAAKAKGATEGKKEVRQERKESMETTGEGLISIDEFSRVSLKAGKILSASTVEGADKLLKIELDLGEEKPRTVFAGIRSSYTPEELVGLTVASVANLQPRKMKFGVSEAMLLAAGGADGLTLFVPHRSARPGDPLK